MAVTVRYATRGGSAVKQDMQAIGQAGEQAFERIRRSGQRVNPVLRGISASVNDVQGELNGLAGRAGLAGTVLSNFGPAGAAAGAALAGITVGLAKAVESSANFEAAMVDLAAAAQATGEQVAPVGDLARRLGVQYGVGAEAVARATDELLRAGVSTEEALGGAAEGALLLARATGSDTAQGVSVAVQAMQLFGLGAERMGDVANQATGVINETKQTLEDYALALGQGGAVAKGAGVSFEDFNAALAATASAFFSGSSQGTSFKVFLQRLVPQSEEAAAAMQRLGFEAFDAQGKLKSIDVIAEDLARAIDRLTEEDRKGVLTQVFGTDAETFALALADNAARVRELRDAIIPATDAAAQAEARMEGLRGAQARAKAQAQELGIAIGEAGLTGAMEGAVNAAGELARVLAVALGSNADLATRSVKQLRKELDAIEFSGEAAAARFGQPLQRPDNARAGAIREELRRRPDAAEGLRRRTLAQLYPIQGVLRPGFRVGEDGRIFQTGQAVQSTGAASPARDLQSEAAAEERAARAAADAERERAEALRQLEQVLRSVETPLEQYRRELAELTALQQQFPASAEGLSRAAEESARDFLEAAGEAAGLEDSLRELDGAARETALDAYGAAVQRLAAELASGVRTAEEAAAALAQVGAELRQTGEAAQGTQDLQGRIENLFGRTRTREEDANAQRENDTFDVESALNEGLISNQQADELLGRIADNHKQILADGREWRDTVLAGAAGLVDGLVRGIAEGKKLKDIASDLAGSLLSFATSAAFSFLGSGSGGGGGGGGFGGGFGAALQAFGGGRAGGGPTRGGFRYDLAEDGRPELFMLGGKGQVYSAGQTVQMLQQAAGGGQAAAAAQAGRLQIVLRDETGGRIETRQESAGDAERLVLLVRRVNEQDFASGWYDPQLRSRYGLTPRAAR